MSGIKLSRYILLQTTKIKQNTSELKKKFLIYKHIHSLFFDIH